MKGLNNEPLSLEELEHFFRISSGTKFGIAIGKRILETKFGNAFWDCNWEMYFENTILEHFMEMQSGNVVRERKSRAH